MTKSELIEQISEKLKLPNGKAEQIINCVFDSMVRALQDGEGIEIRGFGSFTVREYKSYEGRNPRTGETVHVAPKRLPFFKVGKDLRERVNDAWQSDGTEDETAAAPGATSPTPASSSAGDGHSAADGHGGHAGGNSAGDPAQAGGSGRPSLHPVPSTSANGLERPAALASQPGFGSSSSDAGFAPSAGSSGSSNGSPSDSKPSEPHNHGSSANPESTPPGSTSSWD